MQSFLDRERDLSWITFKSSEYQTQSYLSLIDKLNSWKSESLNRFILDCETENLGDLLSGYLSKCEESKIFFAFDKQSLIDKNPLGIVILEPQTDLYAESEFKKYIRECIKDKSMKKAGKLSLIKTIKALIKQTDSNNMNIDYLIINPNNENKGVYLYKNQIFRLFLHKIHFLLIFFQTTRYCVFAKKFLQNIVIKR